MIKVIAYQPSNAHHYTKDATSLTEAVVFNHSNSIRGAKNAAQRAINIYRIYTRSHGDAACQLVVVEVDGLELSLREFLELVEAESASGTKLITKDVANDHMRIGREAIRELLAEVK